MSDNWDKERFARQLLEEDTDSETADVAVEVLDSGFDLHEVTRLAGVIDVAESLPEGSLGDLLEICRDYGWELSGSRLQGVDETDNREVVDNLYGGDIRLEYDSERVHHWMRLHVGTFHGEIPEDDTYLNMEAWLQPRVVASDAAADKLNDVLDLHETDYIEILPSERDGEVYLGEMYIGSKNADNMREVTRRFLDQVEESVRYEEHILQAHEDYDSQ